MVAITEDPIKLLDGLSTGYRRGRHPEAREAARIASVLRVAADDLETRGFRALPFHPGRAPPAPQDLIKSMYRANLDPRYGQIGARDQ